ncbi:MAG: preprotein translocase subunit SecA [Candidatus Yanofskybacteria bacterium]|nr:preprotein translocase subunit SecA [Candidatus Yanofskybacteria bacterium]
MSILSKIFGDANKRTIEGYQPIVQKINELELVFERFSLEELRGKTAEFKQRLAEGEPLDDILPEAFAAVREAAKRTLGQRHFDVQLMGGITLHQGKIAEMRTGEGKTLVATLPAYLNALAGRGVHPVRSLARDEVASPEDRGAATSNGVHIVTVNDYLSRRDAAWMGQIYHLLGMNVGCLNHEMSYVYDPLHSEIQNSKFKIQNDNFKFKSEKENDKSRKLDEIRDETGAFRVVHEFLRPVTRREAYEADITYGTNNEFGFDYLRDNMAYELGQVAQTRGHNYAIVDEIDSILIDEARTPLIISAPDSDSTKLYETFAKIVPRLHENEDYNVDEKLKAVSITEKGIEKVESVLNLKNIYEEGGTRYVHHLEQALKAQILFHRDKDYVVKDGEVIIVDEFTGRLMPGRRWSEGLHQAIEAKEGVYVQKESRTYATITFQNYFRLYKKLTGMTGTAQTSAEEFHKVYKLDVVTIPTNKQMIRADLPDRIYKTEAGKFRAIVAEIKGRHLKGQPVLVGTAAIIKNELLSVHLNREGIPHKVLNAKNHEQEGEIIAQAGRLGAVTVATNMAGRGVDIMLGGHAPSKFKIQNSPKESLRDPTGQAKFKIEEDKLLNEEYKNWEEENKRVKELGGLHVIGTERHEARRIDNQLRGRSGRQGDTGSSQFFVSTEDELVRIFGGDRLKNLMDRLGVSEDDVIENRFVSRAIEQAQSKIEGNNFDIRKYVLEYDDVMNRHRTAIYSLRKEILGGEGVKDKINNYIHEHIDKIMQFHALSETGGYNTEEIAESVKTLMPMVGDLHAKLNEIAKPQELDLNSSNGPGKLSEFLHGLIDEVYIQREQQTGVESMRHIEKMVLLRVIDELWVDHLEQMEYLRDSVRLRAYGQRDPLVEYKIEGQKMFTQLQEAIGAQVAGLIFKVGFVQQPKTVAIEEKREDLAVSRSAVSKQMEQESSRPSNILDHARIGRNAPCFCGSGKKYKRCHGR